MPHPGLFVGAPTQPPVYTASTWHQVLHCSMSGFTRLAVFPCDVRVNIPVLRNITWRVKVRKSAVLPHMIKLLRRVKFI